MSARQGQTALALHRVWHHTSADGRVLGKMATRIARVLMGKHKPTYDPSDDLVDAGDFVVVSDASKVVLTGKKSTKKVYYHHTGYPGGLKTVPITRMMERKPDDIIRKAVSGMLPKNTFRKKRLDRLRIYAGPAPQHDLANALQTWRDLQPTSPPIQSPGLEPSSSSSSPAPTASSSTGVSTSTSL